MEDINLASISSNRNPTNPSTQVSAMSSPKGITKTVAVKSASLHSSAKMQNDDNFNKYPNPSPPFYPYFLPASAPMQMVKADVSPNKGVRQWIKRKLEHHAAGSSSGQSSGK
jgi:hypothetical protein